MELPELRREFRDVRASIDALTQGLVLLKEGMETQTEMLLKLFEAATKEPERSSLTETLEKILRTLNTQTQVLMRFGETVGSVGTDVENAVIRGIHRATGVVTEDGEIVE